jgi:type I restriction enzyme R subunit
MSKANELTFQNDMTSQLQAHDGLLGKAEHYNRELAWYRAQLAGNEVKE